MKESLRKDDGIGFGFGRYIQGSNAVKLLKVLKTLVEEAPTAYMDEQDSCGYCAYCRTVFYMPHTAECPIALGADILRENGIDVHLDNKETK